MNTETRREELMDSIFLYAAEIVAYEAKIDQLKSPELKAFEALLEAAICECKIRQAALMQLERNRTPYQQAMQAVEGEQ